jgi:predicted transcriptional regulator
MLEVDNAGHRFRKAGAQGFPQSRFGGGCPKLPVHAAFAQPGQLLVEAVEMPDGAEFLTIARTLEGPQGAFNERPRRTAMLLGCDIGFRDEIVYGAALPGVTAGAGAKAGQVAATPVGPACRLCERSGCLARAEPPVTRPLGLDEMATGLSAFDFQ